MDGVEASISSRNASSKAPPVIRFMEKTTLMIPGVALCAAIAAVSYGAQAIEEHLLGRPALEALVLAILAGALVRSLWTPSERWNPGVQFSGKFLLELAVMLLGASLSAGALAAAGPILLGGVAIVVAGSLAASYGIARLFRLPHKMALLVACGNSICGNSAIAAVASVIEADGKEVAASISFTAILGVVAVVALPGLVPLAASLVRAIWRAGRPDPIRRATGSRRHRPGRSVERADRHGGEADPRADSRPGPLRRVAVAKRLGQAKR